MSVFEVDIGDPQTFDSKATVYLLTIKTDYQEFQGLGIPISDSENINLREIKVRRRFSEFSNLREQLRKECTGNEKPPPMPGKSLFNRFDEKVVRERVAAFHELFKFIGSDSKYRSSQSVLGFLQDVEVPDWNEVKKALDARTAEVMGIPESEWMDKSEKDGAKVSVRHMENSKLYMVRSEIVVTVELGKMVKLYNDLDDWKNWNSDCSFRKIEDVDESSMVMSVTYKLPVLDNRETCTYSRQFLGLPNDRDRTDCYTSMAMSIEHPLAPKLKGFQRAILSISVITMEPCGPENKHTKFRSLIHADPAGIIPSKLVNTMLGKGTQQLLEMKAHFEKTA